MREKIERPAAPRPAVQWEDPARAHDRWRSPFASGESAAFGESSWARGRGSTAGRSPPRPRVGFESAPTVRFDGAGTSLAVGTPGDRWEREADRVAEAVVNSSGTAPRVPDAGVPAVMGSLQREAAPGSASTSSCAPSLVGSALHGSGRPLEPTTRARMESHLQADLGAVRIHTDADAAKSAGAVGARAYTVGRDIVFGPGLYAPHTTAGLRLLAHELTHVVQQGGVAHQHGSHGGAGFAVTPTGGVCLQGDLLIDPLSSLVPWNRLHNAVVAAAIRGVRGTQAAGVARLRAMARRLPPTAQVAFAPVLGAFEAISDLVVRVALAVVGVAAGFTSGISTAVGGILRLVSNLFEVCARIFLDVTVNGRLSGPFLRQWAEELEANLHRVLQGFRPFVEAWLQRYEAASEDQQTVMIGEIVGEIEAFLATIAVAGNLPRATIATNLGGVGGRSSLLLQGGRSLTEGLGVALPASFEVPLAVPIGVPALGAQVLAMSGGSWQYDNLPHGDLERHESRRRGEEGGHTLQEHVEKTDAQLQSEVLADLRAGRTPKASSFADVESATELVDEALGANESAIRAWVQKPATTAGAREEFSMAARGTRITGRCGRIRSTAQTAGRAPASYTLADTEVVAGQGVKVVLIRAPNRLGGYYVFTAFPTP